MNESMKTVGEIIAEAREKMGLSKRELSRLAKISDTELARIESGKRELPSPKTLRKISQHIGVNYNDLMYASGQGFQVSKLNPFLIKYYSTLKGEKINEALINTLGSIETWQGMISELKNDLNNPELNDNDKKIINQTIEDTEYQINTANEIVNLLHSAKMKERYKNGNK